MDACIQLHAMTVKIIFQANMNMHIKKEIINYGCMHTITCNDCQNNLSGKYEYAY